MKKLTRNYTKLLIVILFAGGLLYAFYNVASGRIQGQENLKRLDTVTKPILKAVNEAERLQCNASVYLQLEDEQKQDASENIEFIHDLKNQRMQVVKDDKKEIYDYRDKQLNIYSKGISPVYSKEDAGFTRIPTDRWFHYTGETMYGVQRRKGVSDQISYGYLKDEEYLLKVRRQGEEEIGEKKYQKYKAVIRNTLKETNRGAESDNEFRKTISANGLDVMDLKKGYPEVYKLLKDTYNRGSEELYIWVDEDGKLSRIEKDYTFAYYIQTMKQNSEKIQQKVGQYGYPRVFCRQDYTYNPTCKNIEMPKDFEEL